MGECVAGIFGAVTFGCLMFMRLFMHMRCFVVVVGMSMGLLDGHLFGLVGTGRGRLGARNEACEKNCGKSGN